MKPALIEIYQCLCDPTRLRILNLLLVRPLCVCHLQEVLGEAQVKLSKHLRYLKQHGMVECHRYQNWNIYCLPSRRGRELDRNLRCLHECAQDDPLFRLDRRGLERIDLCCELEAKVKALTASGAGAGAEAGAGAWEGGRTATVPRPRR